RPQSPSFPHPDVHSVGFKSTQTLVVPSWKIGHGLPSGVGAQVPPLSAPHAVSQPLQPGSVVVVLPAVVVVVVAAGQLGPVPGAGHASQQLEQVPTVPVQCAASRLILHFVPAGVVTQHVTCVGLPQTECDAHFLILPAQLRFTRTAFTCCAA